MQSEYYIVQYNQKKAFIYTIQLDQYTPAEISLLQRRPFAAQHPDTRDRSNRSYYSSRTPPSSLRLKSSSKENIPEWNVERNPGQLVATNTVYINDTVYVAEQTINLSGNFVFIEVLRGYLRVHPLYRQANNPKGFSYFSEFRYAVTRLALQSNSGELFRFCMNSNPTTPPVQITLRRMRGHTGFIVDSCEKLA